ncbi:MAG TPA: DegQ family serine endoprotease [Porticoccaceae bacterium]|nr:DegQ family serine endoprotease [Porticoccaceae bacterium]
MKALSRPVAFFGLLIGGLLMRGVLMRGVLIPGLLVVLAQVPAQAGELPDFTQLIAASSPAVVKINTEQKVSSRRPRGMPPEVPEMFRDFFGQPPGGERERRRQAMGSGFVISADGYIVTNNHVIDGADDIQVRFSDRREYEAKVVGADARSDLALLKIEAKGLPTVRLGADDDLRVGEWVVAIGSPFGLDYSASAGIVSAIGRSLPTERGEDYVPFIQSDVAINPGNSGGPLFNLKGEVVGVNSQIFTRSGGSIGLSFSIPVRVVREVVGQLQESGHVVRGWLGVYIQDVDRALAESLHLDNPQGALIAQIEPGSPAADAGFEAGDVVTEFNGRRIVDASDLPHTVGLMKPGAKAGATVIRKGDRIQLKVTVGGRPGETTAAAGAAQGDRLGVEVEEVDEQMRENWRLPGGVAVTQVYPESAADLAGLQPGDIIVQLGYNAISGVADYERIIAELPANTPVALRFFRRGRSIFSTVELE